MSEGYRLYSSLPGGIRPRVYASIDTGALGRNYRKLASRLPAGCEPVGVVKADAYGHSAAICVPELLRGGCRFFAVSSPEEALAVREICDSVAGVSRGSASCIEGGADARILILGYSCPESVPILIGHRIEQSCFSPEYAGKLSRAATACGGRLKIHIKLDTGMNRLGFAARRAEDVGAAVDEIKKAAALPGLEIAGAFSHFFEADEKTPEAEAATRAQAAFFLRVTDGLIAAGIPLKTRHICNTAGTLLYPEYALDACRLGIGLYGLDPSPDAVAGLEPVLKLKTEVSHVHLLRKGESVSYGGTFTAGRDMRLVTLPIGYADGFIRAYSGAEAVIYSPSGVRKGTVRTVGRICMDQCMADASGCDAEPGDTAVLIGEPGQIADLAARAGTINYECVCVLSSRVPRFRAE